MIHRDIKPSNLMLARSEAAEERDDLVVKVLDLGIAVCRQGEAADEITASQDVVGTVTYMAPEQLDDSRNVDRRADIFSLGATPYRMLTGSRLPPPWHRNRIGEGAGNQLAGFDDRIPKPLIDVLQRMLETDPEDRSGDLAEVTDSLGPYCKTGQFSKSLVTTVRELALTSDGAHLVTGGDRRVIEVWNLESGRRAQSFDGHRRVVKSVAVSPDGSTIASISADHTLRLWDLQSGMPQWTRTSHSVRGFPDHWGQFASVAFSPDGTLLASAAYDGTIRVWNPRTGEQLHAIRICPPYGMICQVAFMSDGRHLLTANGNGTVYVLRIAERGHREPIARDQ